MNLNRVYCKFKARHTFQVLIFPTQNLDSLETPWTPTTHTSVEEALGKQPNLIPVFSLIFISFRLPKISVASYTPLLSLLHYSRRHQKPSYFHSRRACVSTLDSSPPSLATLQTPYLFIAEAPHLPTPAFHSHLPVQFISNSNYSWDLQSMIVSPLICNSFFFWLTQKIKI